MGAAITSFLGAVIRFVVVGSLVIAAAAAAGADFFFFLVVIACQAASKSVIPLTLAFIEELKWFLTELSVLPGSNLAISAQRLPISKCACKIILSSSSDQARLLIPGPKWLCQRSRACLPMRPGRASAIKLHLFGPYWATSCFTFSSSSSVQGPLCRSGFNTFCQR